MKMIEEVLEINPIHNEEAAIEQESPQKIEE